MTFVLWRCTIKFIFCAEYFICENSIYWSNCYTVKCRYNIIKLIHITGDLWGVYCEDYGENWQRYNGTALYTICQYWSPEMSWRWHNWHKPTTWINIYYSDVMMDAVASQITSVSIVYSTVCSGTDKKIHQSSTSLAFVKGIHPSPVNSPHKGPVTRQCLHLKTSSCWPS